MKKSLLLLGILLSTNLYAAKINTYQQVVSAVENGDVIRININFDLCKTTGARRLHGLGSYTPNEVIIDMGGDVIASLSHFTTNDPVVPNHPVYQYVRYQFSPTDNTVQVSINVLDAANYSNVENTMVYTCDLGDGAQVYNKS